MSEPKTVDHLADHLSFTVPEAAKVSGIPVQLVRAAVLSGDLESFTVPGSSRQRIRRRELEAWLDAM